MNASSSAVFVYSLTSVIVSYLTGFLVLWLIGGVLLLSGPQGIAGSVWFFLLGGVMLLGVIRNWLEPVRSAEFYEDYLRLVGRRMNQEISYSKIEEISMVHVFPAWTNPNHIRIRIKEQQGALILSANPKIKKVKLDLYTWLLQKTDRLLV